MDIFLDCEMTSLESPSLLSVGLVTSGGRRCCAEMDLATPIGRHRLAQTPWDVREIVIDGRWGLVPGASCDSDAGPLRAPRKTKATLRWLCPGV